MKRTALLRISQEGIQRYLPLTKGTGRDYRIEASSLTHGWVVPLPCDSSVEFTAPVTLEMLNRRRADFETLVRETLERLTPADTDEQWTILEPMIPAAQTQRGGRRREVDMREAVKVNTILYLNRSGYQWDMLPHNLLPKTTVDDYFGRWRDDSTWAKILDTLREQTRGQAGLEPTPSAAPVFQEHVRWQLSSTRRAFMKPLSSGLETKRRWWFTLGIAT